MTQSPIEKEWAEQRRKRTAKLPVPPKNKPGRRLVAQTRNGWRATLRGKDATAKQMRKFTDQLGAGYYCSNCKKWVAYRRANEHNARCAWETKEMERAARDAEKQIKKNDAAPVIPIDRRIPSKTKEKAMGKNSGWDTGKHKPEEKSAPSNNGSGPAPSTASSGLSRAYQNWSQTELKTVSDLRAHLLGLDAAMEQSVKFLEDFVQTQIIAKKIHPAVAMEVQNYIDTMASAGHFGTRAVMAFERIYQGRLEYARQGGPKPDDAMFSEVD